MTDSPENEFSEAPVGPQYAEIDTQGWRSPLRPYARPLLVFLTLFALVQGFRLSLYGSYGTDEYTYAHAAWAIAQGQQPFRDFFLHHFPLSMQIGSLVFLGESDPSDIQHLRWLILPFAAGTLILLVVAGKRQRGLTPWLVVPILLGFRSWLHYGTQFRPDAVALPLFLSSLLLVTSRRGSSRGRAFAGGLLWTAAVWASQKVLIYGSIIPLAWIVDTALRRAHGKKERSLLNSSHLVAIGALSGAALVALYLTLTDCWGAWYRWCYEWGIVHETVYPHRSPFISLRETLIKNGHLLLLAGYGLVLASRKLASNSGSAWHSNPDLLFIAAALTTSTSYLIQNAAYQWSLTAPLPFLALFAARGLAQLIEHTPSFLRSKKLRTAYAILLLLVPFFQLDNVSHILAKSHRNNHDQRVMMAQLGRLTRRSDAIYDNTGMYVARPHVHFVFFTDHAARIQLRDLLVNEMPTAIENSDAMVSIVDNRFRWLPPPLQEYLQNHFLKITPRIALWGKLFSRLEGVADEPFHALRESKYYIISDKPLDYKNLLIDGKAVKGGIVALERGFHEVAWKGIGTAPSFAILWLPRDGSLPSPFQFSWQKEKDAAAAAK